MKNATASIDASSPSRPAPRSTDDASALPAVERPLLPWDDLGEGRYAAHAQAHDAVLSPLPAGQQVRLLEVDGDFHILTGRIDDDRAMQLKAEAILAGF